jgi:hypothetical protein
MLENKTTTKEKVNIFAGYFSPLITVSLFYQIKTTN